MGNYAWAKMSHSRKSLNVSRLGSYRDCYCVYVSVCVSMYVYVRERQITTDCVCWCFQSAVSVLLRDSLHSIPLPSPTEDRFTSLPASLVLVKKQTNKKDFYRHRAPPFMLIWLWLGRPTLRAPLCHPNTSAAVAVWVNSMQRVWEGTLRFKP